MGESKSFLAEVLEQDILLREQVRPGLMVTALEAELGMPDIAAGAGANEALALCRDLDSDGILRVMFLLAEFLTPPETRTEPMPPDRACVETLKTACWLPSGHRMMVIRDLLIFEIMKRRGSSAAPTR